jgi:hypothetical protein
VEAEQAVLAARRTQLNHYVSFALVQLGRTADRTAAEGVFREAIVTADSAGAGWFAAHARTNLAGLLNAKGDKQQAAALLDEIASTKTTNRHFFYLALAAEPWRF